jgi:hypothetical protein
MRMGIDGFLFSVRVVCNRLSALVKLKHYDSCKCIIEDWLTSISDDFLFPVDAGSAGKTQKVTGMQVYEKVVQTYVKEVLGDGNHDWIAAQEFLKYNEVLCSQKIEVCFCVCLHGVN